MKRCIMLVSFEHTHPFSLSRTSLLSLQAVNISNMHLHGIHTSPLVDDVSISVHPGDSWTYVYDIPSDHHPSSSWYHAHSHANVHYQLMGGLLGMMVVEPSSTINYPDSLANMQHTSLVFTRMNFKQSMQAGAISQGW